MDELNRGEFVESDFEPLKIYFDQRNWDELSVYEKQRFARIKRNYENLVEMGINPVVPPFMVKKKRVEIATCSQTDSRKKKMCPETFTINPPINTTTSNHESGSEQAEGDVEITEVRRSNWIPTIDWENLPLGESNPFIPDESDEMNIDLILEGTLKNFDSLKLLCKPCDFDICDSARESDNEPRPRFPKRNVPKVCYREEDVSSDDDYICVIKNSKYDRGIAPSSSTRKRSSSETFPEELKGMSRKPTVSQAINSSDIPGDVNKYHISQQSDCRTPVSRGISTETDGSEKSRFSKRNRMDCVAEDNLVLRDENKQVSTTAKNRVLRKCHACPHCDYKTSRIADFRRHIAVHEGIRPYKCQLCDYRASQAVSLRKHVDAVHDGKKPYKCQHCDYRASCAPHLRTHVAAVHERKKPHPCPHCDYRAIHTGHVRQHVRAVHERRKPYGCRICDYRASLNCNLRRHMKAVHAGKINTAVTKM